MGRERAQTGFLYVKLSSSPSLVKFERLRKDFFFAEREKKRSKKNLKDRESQKKKNVRNLPKKCWRERKKIEEAFF